MPGRFLSEAVCERARRLAQVHSQETVLQLTRIGKGTLHALKKRDFAPARRKPRPVPSDWAIVAPAQTALWLQRHYGASPNTVARWRREKPVPMIGKGHRRKPVPPDLAEVMARMTVTEAEAHYGVANATLTKWRLAAGLGTRFVPAVHVPAVGWVERYVEARR